MDGYGLYQEKNLSEILRKIIYNVSINSNSVVFNHLVNMGYPYRYKVWLLYQFTFSTTQKNPF